MSNFMSLKTEMNEIETDDHIECQVLILSCLILVVISCRYRTR